MESFQLVLDTTSKTPLYYQIYVSLRDGILAGDIARGEKLPSLRAAAKILGVSITTILEAYNQLSVEGYVKNQPKSGYFASGIDSTHLPRHSAELIPDPFQVPFDSVNMDEISYIDPECFDFLKWKKCLNQILTDYPHLLLTEGDPQGEFALRSEISRYAYQHRGVQSTPGQIIIGAGIQPIIEFLSLIVKKLEIHRLAIENPGFPAVQRIFSDRDFEVFPVPVDSDGIRISALPNCQHAIAYVSPSNQFPLGAVMPIGKRYALLEWARNSHNYILEDDYDSELRYYGKPIPSLQGMDSEGRVIYLGSFSTTLFPSIKISYMVLPETLLHYARSAMDGYRQTCSKSEQLTLALYMKNGLFLTHIKKLRRLYAQKMHKASDAMKRNFDGTVRIVQSISGVNMLLSVEHPLSAGELCRRASTLHLDIAPVTYFSETPNPKEGNPKERKLLLFHFANIPSDKIASSIQGLSECWEK
jgi:GntR family transcriptional regulator / MocR family aminotransferase